jgi:hypothetical protein
MNAAASRWARRGLTVVAAALGCVSLLGALHFLHDAGWSNDRTILYAAEGGVMSPREALVIHLLFLVAALVWSLVFAATVFPIDRRARLAFRATATGVASVALVAAGGGLLCEDVRGHVLLGVLFGLPMVLAGTAVRQWAMPAPIN